MADRSTSKSTEKLEPKEQRLRKIKKDGGSRGSSRSSSCSASRESTPKPLPKKPKNQYTREKLMQLRLSPMCKKRPICMDQIEDCDLPDVIRDEPIGLEDISTGRCEPEMWYKHIRHLQDHDSRGNSPLTVGGPERKRFGEAVVDGDTAYKKRGADLRGKEEEDEMGGIVLGPQRKSFGTGCHVTTNFSRRNDSPKEHERDGLRSRGRIGSGRITVDHERERVSDRTFRDRELREVRDTPPRRFERGDSRGSFERSDRGAYDKDRYQRNRDYDNREDDRRDRDYGERRYDNRRSYGRHDQRSNNSAPEPEWFTSGPSSQSDTIELVGFEERRSPVETVEETHSDYRQAMQNSQIDESMQEEQKETCVSVADRNGSLETNESSSPEHSQNSDDDHINGVVNQRRHLHMEARTKDMTAAGGAGESFDLNDIFIKNIPGLSDMIGSIDREVPTPTEGVGSRFSQWFQPGSRGSTSRENSRRSSMNEDFSYLHEMLNGSKSPVIPSPPLTSQHMAMFHHHHGSYPSVTSGHLPVSSSSLEAARQHQNLIELLGSKGMLPPPPPPGQNQVNVYHAQHSRTLTSVSTQQGAVSVSDVEASLKALLLPGGTKKPHSEQNSIKNIPNLVVPPGGMVLTAEELEASLTGNSTTKAPPTGEPKGGGSVVPPSGFADLPRKIRGQGMGDVKVIEQAFPGQNVRNTGIGNQSEASSVNSFYHQQNVFSNTAQNKNINGSHKTTDIFPNSSLSHSLDTRVIGSQGYRNNDNNHLGAGDSIGGRQGDPNRSVGSSGTVYMHSHSGARVGGWSEKSITMPPMTQGRPIYSSAQTMSAGLQSSSNTFDNYQEPLTNTPISNASYRLPAQIPLDGGLNSDFLPRRPSIEKPCLTQSPAVIQSGAKVTTLAELEEELNPRHLGARDKKILLTGQAQDSSADNGGNSGLRITPDGGMMASQQQDMAAFNKLLGMMKGAGENSDPSVQTIQQQALNLQQMQKEPITRRDMIQKIVQQQQQAKAQQAAAAVKQLQQQQVKLQQQQQLQVLKHLMGKHSAGSVKSPIPPNAAAATAQQPPPPLSLQPPQASVSPRCPSPLLQPPVSPRAPSPIMFGSQPPLHLTAPSPIHASPVLPGNPNTLQVSQASAANPALARVPSPQELIVHTQAIMQNALIKRQLEEQKERFLKRQQAKSPNTGGNVSSPASNVATSTSISVAQTQAPPSQTPSTNTTNAQAQPNASEGEDTSKQPVSETPQAGESGGQGAANTSVASNMTSTPASTKAAVNPAFTPTSVIRKMVTEKADEKEKDTKQLSDAKPEKSTPVLRIVKEHGDGVTDTLKTENDNVSVLVPEINAQQPTSQTSTVASSAGSLPQQQPPPLMVSGIRQARHPVIQGLMNIPQQPPQLQPQQMFQSQPSVGPGHGTPAVHPAGLIPSSGNHVHQAGPGPALPGPMMGVGGPTQPSSGPIIGTGPSLVTGTTPAIQSGRPIIKGNSPGGSNPLSPLGPQQFNPSSAVAPNASQQRPIVGGNAPQILPGMNQSPQITVDTMRFLEQQRQLQAQLAAGVSAAPRGRPITGRRTSPANTVSTPQSAVNAHQPPPPVNPLVANQALLMQKMMMPGSSPAAVQQIQQLAALQAQVLQQPHQQQPPPQRPGIVDPRLASNQVPPSQVGGRPIFGTSGPGAVAGNHLSMPVSSGSTGGRVLQGQPDLQSLTSTSVAHPFLTSSVAGSVGVGPASHDGNLAKFFGNDLLKQQINAMPPLPNQSSQRVLTLEEIERRQQMVTN